MSPTDLRTLARDYFIDLLNAPDLTARAEICREIADDPSVTTIVLMSLLEQVRPLRSSSTVQLVNGEGFIQ